MTRPRVSCSSLQREMNVQCNQEPNHTGAVRGPSAASQLNIRYFMHCTYVRIRSRQVSLYLAEKISQPWLAEIHLLASTLCHCEERNSRPSLFLTIQTLTLSVSLEENFLLEI